MRCLVWAGYLVLCFFVGAEGRTSSLIRGTWYCTSTSGKSTRRFIIHLLRERLKQRTATFEICAVLCFVIGCAVQHELLWC